MIVEFETQLDNNTIHLPEEVAVHLMNGTAVHVSIRPMNSTLQNTNVTHAWDAFLKITSERRSLYDDSKSYEWKREDAYAHLK